MFYIYILLYIYNLIEMSYCSRVPKIKVNCLTKHIFDFDQEIFSLRLWNMAVQITGYRKNIRRTIGIGKKFMYLKVYKSTK